MEYKLDNLCTGNVKQDEMNSLIMDYTSDFAEILTEKECIINNIDCWLNDGVNEPCFSEEAQDIFNYHYDEFTENIYKLINEAIKIDKQ